MGYSNGRSALSGVPGQASLMQERDAAQRELDVVKDELVSKACLYPHSRQYSRCAQADTNEGRRVAEAQAQAFKEQLVRILLISIGDSSLTYRVQDIMSQEVCQLRGTNVCRLQAPIVTCRLTGLS